MSSTKRGVATGHVGAVVLFKNTSTSTCSLYGYPGAAGLDSSGKQAVQFARTPSGFIGGLSLPSGRATTVVLKPGATASSIIEGTDIPNGDPSTPCPSYTGVLITPPGTTRSTTLTLDMPGCSVPQIHPVVPGTTGNQS